VSLSLAGDLSYLDLNKPDRPAQVVRGHNKFVTALAVDPTSRALYTGSYDSQIFRWDAATAIAAPFQGTGHGNAITQMHLAGSNLVTISMDDSIRYTSLSTLTYSADKTALDGQPSDLAVGRRTADLAVVSTNQGVSLLRGGKQVASVKSPNATAVAISPDESSVAVGDKDNKITVYSIGGNALTQQYVLNAHRGPITRLAYSPDGQFLASADVNREILVWPATGREPSVRGWVFHNARVNDLAWSPDSIHLASVSLDQSIIVWNVKSPDTRLLLKGAHVGGVNSVRWLDDKTLATAGQDCCAKTWNVSY